MELTAIDSGEAPGLREVSATFSSAVFSTGGISDWRQLSDRLVRCWAYVLAHFLHVDEVIIELVRGEASTGIAMRVTIPPESTLADVLASSDHLLTAVDVAGGVGAPQCLLWLADTHKVAPPLPHPASAGGLLCSLATVNENAIRLTVRYDQRRHSPIWVEALVKHFSRLAMRIARGEPVDPVEWLDDAERQCILEKWNETTSDDSAEQCLHWLFERQVERTPEAEAAEFDGERLSFRELDARARSVAVHLLQLGVYRGALVPICAERSLDLLVGVLGILKCGAAYVPIDPDFPARQRQQILAECEPPAVLVQRRFCERIPGSSAPLAIIEDVGNAQTVDLPVAAPGDVACVMYTSGSTGAPKGTLINHRSLANNIIWLQANWPLTAGDSVLQKTPFTFDVSIKELLWPLAFGARVVIALPRRHLDMAYLVRLIHTRQVTVAHFVPSLLQRFLDTPQASECRSLRLVMCGAEVLPPRLKDCFFSVLDAKLLHLYGPTEAAISVTGWECDRQREDGPVIPLGRPMSNVQIYLLDCSRRPVPAGVPGEIFIGGMAVARGYLKRPQLTAERFLPNPFRRCREGDDLLYRTGDLARFRSDGILEFIGRIDQQVKIHGARVEPREVEITLNRHPAVKRAAVRPQPDRHGETRLIAYVLVEEQSPPSLFSLREHCAAALPAFMVPAAFVVVEEMPLLTNGKIDYSRLPALEGQP